MDAPHVRFEVRGQVAWLTLDRPEMRNALSEQAMREIGEGIERAEQDVAVRAVVLTGGGEKIFCAGGDLSTMSGEGGFLGGHESRRAYGLMLKRIQDCRKPTIARVNGHALAGGLGLVLACDIAVAADAAGFGLPEIDRGLFPMQVIALLQRHLGRKQALWLVMSGTRISAAEALGLGLVNRVVPAPQLDVVVAELAQKLAGKSLAVLALGRRAFATAEDLPLPAALEYLASQLSLNILAEDTSEGVSAFLEKREPHWKDR
ncbi:MAG: enoyl-CoA hydratase/isomerase family protein [Myxococcales bacterium]